MVWKTSPKPTRVKPKQKVRLEVLGLAGPEPSAVSIEEIRRQGLMLAGRSVGPSYRPQSVIQTTPQGKVTGTVRRVDEPRDTKRGKPNSSRRASR